MARYGLLECSKNFKGTLNKNCDICDCIDARRPLAESPKKKCFNDATSAEALPNHMVRTPGAFRKILLGKF